MAKMKFRDLAKMNVSDIAKIKLGKSKQKEQPQEPPTYDPPRYEDSYEEPSFRDTPSYESDPYETVQPPKKEKGKKPPKTKGEKASKTPSAKPVKTPSRKPKIGFDIGNSSIKIAIGRRGGLELHEVRLPENMVEDGEIAMPNAFSDFLRKVKKDLRLPHEAAALVLPANQSICRLVTMPKMSQSQLMMNLPYEFNDFIHGEPEQYYCDYAVCEPTPAEEEKGEMALMAAVAHKERITGYLKMFSRAGISLKILLPQEMALVQLVQSYQERNPQAAVKFCFVDIGYNTTQITIVSGDRLEAVRQVHIGGRDLDEVVADELNIDPFLADSYMRKNHMDILNHPRCVDVYNQLAIEILKVINFYHFTAQGSDLESIYLIGGCANIPALRHTIGDTLGMEIHTAHELLPISEGKQEDYKTGILAAGVALAREV